MHLRGVGVVLLVCAPTMAQNPPTPARAATPDPAGACAAPEGEFSFYGGDLDHRALFTSERNTSVADSWTFDDFDWIGGFVGGVFSNYLDAGIGTPTGADVVFYACLGEGEFGTCMGQFNDLPVVVTPTGRIGFGYFEFRMDVELSPLLISLPPGTYHVGIRPVGTGAGRAYVSTTSGANAYGSPIANGNTFLQSDFLGVPLPANWEHYAGGGPWDVSYGVNFADGTWGWYALTIAGSCPGEMTISWGGAPRGKRQAIIYSTGLGHALVGGPCGAMASGLASVHLIRPAFPTGAGCGQVRGTASAQACGKYIQLVSLSDSYYPCEMSRVVKIP